MPEPLLARARRLASTSLQTAIATIPNPGGPAHTREAIRDIERTSDDLRDAHHAATTRRNHALRQQRMFREQLAVLDDKARLALASERQDLAEAALNRQIDFEHQIGRLATTANEAADEAAQLDHALASLTARAEGLQSALDTFEAARRQGATVRLARHAGARTDDIPADAVSLRHAGSLSQRLATLRHPVQPAE